MKLNQIDLGTYNPLRQFHSKQILGDTFIENGGRIAWRRGGEPQSITVRHWILAPTAVGGAASGSQAANEYMMRWLEELAGNEDFQPMYVQWSSLRSLPQDGWWFLTDAVPDYKYTGGGQIPIDMTFVQRVPGGSPVSIFWDGGNLKTAYTVAPTNLIGLPANTVGPAVSGYRQAAEGNIAYLLNPATKLVQFQASSVLADLFSGSVHVYDANASIGVNPVPIDGTFANTSWVEVRGTDHRFVGDIVVTNGLYLITIQLGVGVSVYVWNTNLAPLQWQQIGSLQSFDNSNFQQLPTQVRFQRLGYEEANLDLTYTNQQSATVRLRIIRSSYALWLGFRPLSYSNVSPRALVFAPAVSGNLIVYNSAKVADQQFVGERSILPPTTDAGYGSAFVPSAGSQWLVSWLYQNAPTGQPYVAQTGIGTGDESVPAKGVWAFYGLGIMPFPTTNLRGEAESGALSGGFVSAADTAASGGNAAKLPSGTAAGAIDTFGTSFTPPAGTYAVYIRYRNSGLPTNAVECRLLSYVNGAEATDLAHFGSADGSVTSYLYKGPFTVTLNGAQTFQFRLSSVSQSAATKDWFFDEAFLVPITLAAVVGSSGPQDLWQQWAFERTATFPVL